MSGVVSLILSLAAVQDDPVDRQVQRLREQLRLTDEQAGKAREIIKRQQDDLKGILTDEQKPRYDEALRGGGGRGQGQGQGNAFGGRGGLFPSTDDLKTRLGLSEDQVTKVNEIRDHIREEMRRMFQDRNNRPGPEAFEKIREESAKKMREVLTDEQKPKFDELLKSVPTPGAQGGEGRGNRGGSIDDRVGRVMELLKFEKPEEADAVKGLVKNVLELQDKVEAAQRESRGKLEELQKDAALTDDAVGDKLTELRKGTKELEKQLAEARGKLSDVVSNRQEVDLMRRGVLR
jgi:hypothetical protein